MLVKTKPWDAAEHLTNETRIQSYLEACFEDGDPELIADAIGVVARARGMSKVAKHANISRQGLYKALAIDGNPSFATIAKAIEALGFQLSIKPKDVAL